MNSRISLSPFQAHKQKWANGCGAEICEGATKVCHFRGKIPCSVLFVGEAPGRTENKQGIPFAGPAGIELDKIVANALKEANTPNLRIGFTNLVGCIPMIENEDEVGGKKKAGRPPKEAIRSCSARLAELFILCKPTLLVRVGDDSKTNCLSSLETSKEAKHILKSCGVVDIKHPAHIMRLPTGAKSLATQTATVILAEAFRIPF